MGYIKSSRTLFFTTSPRSPIKLIPEIKLLVDNFSNQKWARNKELQTEFARLLASNKTIFKGETSKKDSSFSARDRITRSPKALGFVNLEPLIQLTKAGEAFLYGKRVHEIFLRQLLKFQIPSPYHKESKKIVGTFWGRPYLEVMRLIHDLEYLTFDEFRIFALQLTDYRNYDLVKRQVLEFRTEKNNQKGQYKKFLKSVVVREIAKIYSNEIEKEDFSTRESKTKDEKSFINKKERNMRDYADACFRYLRYTELFVSDGRKIKIAPGKEEDVEYILRTIPREPIFLDNEEEFKNYLFDSEKPRLYSDDRKNLERLLIEQFSISEEKLFNKTIEELKDLREAELNKIRLNIKNQQIKDLKSFKLYQEVLDTYKQILAKEVYDAPLFLEWNTWRAITMLDGGTIIGNFKIDDNGNPISTAQGNKTDIECYYKDFSLSVEVTLQRGQRQYETEGEPVTRHYAQLQEKTGKTTYCLFIAEKMSRATIAHFFGLNQITNISAYGGKPKIIPLELSSFINLIETISINKPLKPKNIQNFLQKAIDEIDNSKDEVDWSNKIASNLEKWLEE